MTKVNNKATSTIDAQKDLKKANNLLNDSQAKKKLKKDKNTIKLLADGTVNDLYKEVDEVTQEFNDKLTKLNTSTDERFNKLAKSLDNLWFCYSFTVVVVVAAVVTYLAW